MDEFERSTLTGAVKVSGALVMAAIAALAFTVLGFEGWRAVVPQPEPVIVVEAQMMEVTPVVPEPVGTPEPDPFYLQPGSNTGPLAACVDLYEWEEHGGGPLHGWLYGQQGNTHDHHALPPTLFGRENILRRYYEPMPSVVGGWITRSGPDRNALEELWWTSREAAQQRLHGPVLYAGGYGYQVVNGQEFLIENRLSQGYGLQVDQCAGDWQCIHDAFPLNEGQERLVALGQEAAITGGTQAFRRAFIEGGWTGVIAMKSPNDIGRQFCLYAFDPVDFKVLNAGWPVIVGGTSAQHDYTELSGRSDPLGRQTVETYPGSPPWYWVADVPDGLYGSLELQGLPAFALFVEMKTYPGMPQ